MKRNDHSDIHSREHLRHLTRVFWIDQQIRADRYPNAPSIASHFEISNKTAQRTIDFMRDQLRMPIEYRAERRGWYYTEPHYGLPAIELTEGDLVTILLTEKLARQYRGTAIGRQVETAFGKVLNALTNAVSVELQSLSDAYTFEAGVTTDLDSDLFTRLGQAVREVKTVEMDYFTTSRGELTQRRVDPLHLRNSRGEWYLIAWDHMRCEVRDFLVSRIRRLDVTNQQFAKPDAFDLAQYLNGGFGMIRGQDQHRIEIVFDEYQSRWIRELSQFHPTEEREELPDGRLILRMVVTALDGVKRFVLQYGRNATVISPPQLREILRSEIDAMSQLY
jgi:predicted DNA-binding transcriptional regulator YafY